MSCTIADVAVSGGLGAPLVGVTISATPLYAPFFETIASQFRENAAPRRLATTDAQGNWSFSLPWPSESDPTSTRWSIMTPDGYSWAGVVPEGVAGPLTLHDLKTTYGWGLTAFQNQSVLALQGTRGIPGVNGINGTNKVDNATALRALSAPSGVQGTTTIMSGYRTPGDGGGGVFYWDPNSTLADNGGSHFLPTGQSPSTPGRWVRVIKDFTFNLREWGAQDSEDFSIDCYPAFAAIMAYLDAAFPQPDTRAARIVVPSGFYRSMTAWTCNRAVIIEGQGKLSTFIKFSPLAGLGNPIDGIVFDRQNWPTSTASAASVLRNLTLNGDGATYGFQGPDSGKGKPFWSEYDPQTWAPSGHGIVIGSGVRVHTPCIVENVNVQSFALDGFHVEAIDASLNANVSRVVDCDVNGCGRHGFFLAGENANACTIISPNANNCGGWGVFERSFLGNTYIAGQVAECGSWVRNIHALVDPNIPAITMFAGSSLGGVYGTPDKGTSWTDYNKGIQNVNDPDLDGAGRSSPISCLTVDDDLGHLYAGSNKEYAAYQPGGVFKWANFNTLGGNFAPALTGLTDMDIRALAYDDGVVYAGGHTGGVFKSTDQAATWAASNTGLTTLDVRALAADRSNHGIVYAGTFGGGVFKSTDHGATWAAVNTGLASLNVLCLAAKAGVLYAGCSDGKLYQSTNGGTGWSLIFTEASAHPVQCVAQDPSDATKIYIGTGGGGIYYSHNTGATWTAGGPCEDLINSGVNHDIRAITVSKTGGTVYAGVQAWTQGATSTNPGGVYRSDDAGVTFNAKVVLFSSGGGYWAKEAESATVFVGCYSESDVRNDITNPSVVIGGIMGQSLTPSNKSLATIVGASGIAGAPVFAPAAETSTVRVAAVANDVYVVGNTDRVIEVDTTNFASTVLLLNPSDFEGRHFKIVKKNAAGGFLLVESTGYSFQGVVNNGVYLFNQGEAITVQAIDGDWKIVSRTLPTVPQRAAPLTDPTYCERGQLVYDTTSQALNIDTGGAGTQGTKWEPVSKAPAYTTAGRPAAAGFAAGVPYFDTTLNKPLWSDGAGNWRDATGAIV